MEGAHVAVACSCAEDAVPAAASVEDQIAVNKKMIHINYQATPIKQQRSPFKELDHKNETVDTKFAKKQLLYKIQIDLDILCCFILKIKPIKSLIPVHFSF